MSETCFNTLYIRGNANDVSKFFDIISEVPDIGKHFQDLEKEVENIEGDLDLPCASQRPWIDTFSIDTDGKFIAWESRGYPSMLAAYKISENFPDIEFILDFENTEDELAGYISIKNSIIIKTHLVNFSDGALDILFDNFGNEIMSLKKGDKIEIGVGMVEVICTDAEELEDEIVKKFNLVFQCDSSPNIFVHVPKDEDYISLEMDFMSEDWGIDYIEYSDDDGNEDITENSCHGEMCMHSEKVYPHHQG